MRCMVGEGRAEKWGSARVGIQICPPFVRGKIPSILVSHFHPMASTSDTDSCTAAEPVQILTPPPSPPLAEDDATTTVPPTPAAAKKKKKKKAKKSNKVKDASTSPAPPPTPTPTAEENQPPPLYISRNKHWKYISSFHVRFPLWFGAEGAEV